MNKSLINQTADNNITVLMTKIIMTLLISRNVRKM